MRKPSGLTLSNTTDIVANKISLIQGNTTTDILDLISNAAGNVDSYTRTESDARYYTQSQVNTSLALKVDNTTLTNDYMPTTQLNAVLALKVNTSTLSQYYTNTSRHVAKQQAKFCNISKLNRLGYTTTISTAGCVRQRGKNDFSSKWIDFD